MVKWRVISETRNVADRLRMKDAQKTVVVCD